MEQKSAPNPDLVDRFLRTSRRGLMIVLAWLLIAAATLIAHALRPGSLLADWPSKAPGLIPVSIVLLVAISGVAMWRRQAGKAAAEAVMRSVLEDEFRQSNLLRAQRLALIVVLTAQVPLTALALSTLTTASAVTVMATTTITLGMATLIVSFLYLDRE